MMNKTYNFIKARDFIMRGVFIFCAVFSIFALGCICVFLFATGVPFIGRIGPANFFGTKWNLHENAYGILSMIVASLYLTALSTVIGVTVCIRQLQKFSMGTVLFSKGTDLLTI